MRAIWAALIASIVAACTPTLSTFDRFTPKDRGGRLVLKVASYGEGPRRTLDVYAPRGAAKAPVIIFLYGGSWASGDKSDYRFAGAAFTSRGFVTVIPDYRLGPETLFPGFLEDNAAAVKWAYDNIARYGGDPDRIVLVGHSAGAYNGAMITLDQRYLREVGLAPGVIRGFAGIAGPYDFYPYDAPETIATFAKAPDPAATQPINFARADAPPILLLHGAKDTKVYTKNMISLAAHLKAAGAKNVTTKLYPTAAHVSIMLALSVPLRGRAPVLDDVSTFAHAVTSAATERSLAPAR